MTHATTIPTTNEISAYMINDVRNLILNDEARFSFIQKINTYAVKQLHEVFMDNQQLDEKIAEAFNKCDLAGDIIEPVLVSKLSFKLPLYGAVIMGNSKYYRDFAKLSFAKTLLNGLSFLGYIKRDSKVERFWNEGKVTFMTEITYAFGGTPSKKNMFNGIETIPGQLAGNRVHTKPGGRELKLDSAQKKFLRKLSSKALRLVRTDRSTLEEYAKQTNWYKSALAKNIEDPILLKERVKHGVDGIMEFMDKDRLYLTNWFDSRLRVYYTLTTWGINPQGDDFEKSMWELADAVEINKEGYEELVWSAVVLSHGRRNEEQSLKYWEKHEAEIRAKLLDPEINDFGKIFYNTRLLQAIDDYRNGVPSRFLLGEDATTGGLQHFGTAFHAPKAMKASNVGGLKTVQDAHGVMAKAFEISRDNAKLIQQPLLHGGTMKSVAKTISAHIEGEVDEAYVAEHVRAAYGDEIMNIPKIAEWGTIAYDTNNSTLMFSTSDGMKAQSTCYFKSVKLQAHGIDFRTKAMYSTCVVHRDMPYLVTSKGMPVHDEAKVRGLYANITHSKDATVLRAVDAALYVHDKYYNHPNEMKKARAQYKAELIYSFNNNCYVNAMKEIVENHKGSAGSLPLPELAYGDATLKMVEESHNFLMP